MDGLESLKDIWTGQDVWVIGSGPSLGFIDPGFFNGKNTIGINYAWQLVDVDYVVLKENYAVKDAAGSGQKVVASRWHCGDSSSYMNDGDLEGVILFDHLQNECEKIDLTPVGNELDLGLVVSYSTITSGIHLAAWMGAKNIILVGHDCGSIDGQLKTAGYNKPDFQVQYPDFYKNFVGKIEPQTLALKRQLKAVYGCEIYSLNPFINFGLEGHKFERTHP